MKAERILDADAMLGEGPVWDARYGILVWVDILAGEVRTFQPDTGMTSVRTVGRHVGAVAARAQQPGYVLAVREGFAFLNGELVEGRAPLADRPDLRMNDGACDPAGRFFAGSMAYDLHPGDASLFRLDPDGTLTEVLTGLGLANGIGWSPAADVLYLVDSLARRVAAHPYDPERGRVGSGSPFVEIPAEEGFPDGLTVDAEGCIWVALWGGWRVRRYTPAGVADLEVHLPTAHVTSCTFGGDELSNLYITTARDGLSSEQLERQPEAGDLFVVSTSTVGLPAGLFGG